VRLVRWSGTGVAAAASGWQEGAGSLFFACFSLRRRSTCLPLLNLQSLTGAITYRWVLFGPTDLMRAYTTHLI
jgi:hypothetical protein